MGCLVGSWRRLAVWVWHGRVTMLMMVGLMAAGFTLARADEPASPELKVSRWEPREFAFRGPGQVENPFLVALSVDAKGPDGTVRKVPGFHDGDATWKARVTPDVPGEWTITTRSPNVELDNQRTTFVCVPNPDPNAHGGLEVDRDHPHHFVLEDGTRFYPMGYECDWLWALDLGRADLGRTEALLDRLKNHGFNYIILNAYAHDTGWRKGRTGEDDYGPPPLYAWGGDNETPDHRRFNLDYWRHYDRVIEALNRRGMMAHVMIKVYNKMVNWPAKASPEEDLYFRWLIARYAAYPNVHWDFSKEANNEPDLAYKLDRIGFLRANDPYHRLITVHDDRNTYDHGDYNGLLDYRSDQQHSAWHATLRDHRRQHVWPIINVEFGYEHGPKGIQDRTYEVVQEPEEVCRRAWEVMMAGGYVAYYYTYTAWDVIRPEDAPPGYVYFKHLRDFFETTAYWTLEPADDLTSEGHCLANPGQEYVVFLDQARPFTLKVAGLDSTRPAEWFQPFSGQRREAGRVENETVTLTPPTEWQGKPLVLHLGSPPDRASKKK